MVLVWCDGSITGGNPGGHGWSGWVAKHPDGQLIHHHALDLGVTEVMSNNIAEYMAVRSALRWLALGWPGKNYREHEVRIHSDSQLVIRQLAGQYQVHHKGLKLYYDNCKLLAGMFPLVTYHWVRREENREADAMSKCLHNGGSIPAWADLQASLERPVVKKRARSA
jgi:ribonuclease HI